MQVIWSFTIKYSVLSVKLRDVIRANETPSAQWGASTPGVEASVILTPCSSTIPHTMRITTCHIILAYTHCISNHIVYHKWCTIWIYFIISCDIQLNISYHIMWYTIEDILSYQIISYHIISYHTRYEYILSYHICIITYKLVLKLWYMDVSRFTQPVTDEVIFLT